MTEGRGKESYSEMFGSHELIFGRWHLECKGKFAMGVNEEMNIILRNVFTF